MYPSSNDTWGRYLDINNKNTFSAVQHNMERNVLNITYTDRDTNMWMREQTKVMGIMEIIKNRKWTWTSHISRRMDN